MHWISIHSHMYNVNQCTAVQWLNMLMRWLCLCASSYLFQIFFVVHIGKYKGMLFNPNKNKLPYARHYNPHLIKNSSWILTIYKARILWKKPLNKTFLAFKKWVKNIQTAGYNGARTALTLTHSLMKLQGNISCFSS